MAKETPQTAQTPQAPAPAPAAPAPATAGQVDAFGAMLTARDKLTEAKAKLTQAVKDREFYTRKVDREGAAVLAAQAAFDRAQAAVLTPQSQTPAV